MMKLFKNQKLNFLIPNYFIVQKKRELEMIKNSPVKIRLLLLKIAINISHIQLSFALTCGGKHCHGRKRFLFNF
jgi:hypothetical protein